MTNDKANVWTLMYSVPSAFAKETGNEKESRKGEWGIGMRYTDAELNFFFQFIPLPTSETFKLDEYLCATAAPIRSKFSLFLNWKWEEHAAGVVKSTFAAVEKEEKKWKSGSVLFQTDAYSEGGGVAEINLIT